MIEGLGIEELLRLRTEIAAEIKARAEAKGNRLDKANRRRLAKIVPATLKIMDRRRFIIGRVPVGKTKAAPSGMERTMFPSMVRNPAGDEQVLKDGDNVQKLGGQVLVGELRGAKIVYLALEERATCPRSCAFWTSCYTNGMPQLVRYRHGPELEARIAEDVAALCAAHEKVLIRLHMSGDFYSREYVIYWARLITKHLNLWVFGFTAHEEGSGIGDLIASYRDLQRPRFSIRTSGRTGKWGSFTIPLMAEDRAMIGDAVICPEQRDAMKGFTNFTHCGSCGLCWKSDPKSLGRPIVFYEH